MRDVRTWRTGPPTPFAGSMIPPILLFFTLSTTPFTSSIRGGGGQGHHEKLADLLVVVQRIENAIYPLLFTGHFLSAGIGGDQQKEDKYKDRKVLHQDRFLAYRPRHNFPEDNFSVRLFPQDWASGKMTGG